MDAKSILLWIVIGALAGWLASFVVGGGGLFRYVITGLVGSIVGGYMFQRFNWSHGIANGFIEQVLISAIGAIVVVLAARLIA